MSFFKQQDAPFLRECNRSGPECTAHDFPWPVIGNECMYKEVMNSAATFAYTPTGHAALALNASVAMFMMQLHQKEHVDD